MVSAAPADAFIENRFQLSQLKRGFEPINPATGAVLSSVASNDQADVATAVAAARRLLEDGGWSPAAAETRKELLLRPTNLVREHPEEIASLGSQGSAVRTKSVNDLR